MPEMVYSRVDFTWLDRDEYERRKAEREERAWRRQRNQGDLCCPMVIRDGMDAVQSQVDGRMYDSKSRIRQHYRESGVIEVGSEVQKPLPKVKPNVEKNREAVHRAFAAVDTMSDETIRRRNWEAAQKSAAVDASRNA